MARTRTVRIAALNIAMHRPHSPEQYIELFRAAYKLRQPLHQGALHGAMMGALYARPGPGGEISGEIYRFLKIDPSEPWFNVQTRAPATEEEASQVNIPPNLLAHLQRLPFVFLSKTHELWFITQDRDSRMGPLAVAKFFQQLFDLPVLTDRFPRVEVTAVPQHDSVDRLLKTHTLSRLTIELKRPNADDAASEEARVLERLERQRVRRQVTEMVADKNASIEPDDDTVTLAGIAARNGSVSVLGQDASGERVEDSTVNRPMIRNERVDTAIETTMDVLLRTALNG